MTLLRTKKAVALVYVAALQSPGSAWAQDEQTTSDPPGITPEHFSAGVVNGRFDFRYKLAWGFKDGKWQYDIRMFDIDDDHRWLLSGEANRTALSFVEHGNSIYLVAKPERGESASRILHSAGVLESALPAIEDLEIGGCRIKPRSYEGITLASQPICVTGQSDAHSHALYFGADSRGSTELYFAFSSTSGGSPQSLAGVPGTTWVLPETASVTVGPVKVNGVRLRVLARDYVWQDAHGGRETIPGVLHVEAERTDGATPARLLYRLEDGRARTFELIDRFGVFVYSDLRSRGGVLVESRGWKNVSP